MNNVDSQYIDLLKDIIINGVVKETRSGQVISLFGRMLRFDLKEGLPILTTKKMFTKGVIHELLWFLKGDTNIKYLLENNVHIWDDDAYRYYVKLVNDHNEVVDSFKNSVIFEYSERKACSKEEFLEGVMKGYEGKYASRSGITYYKYGDLGDVYGKQWRGFGLKKIDQIEKIINTLKENPDDRRMLCVAYNPEVAERVALPPCHVMFQFYTRELTVKERYKLFYEKVKGRFFSAPPISRLDEEGIPTRKLSLLWTQRSVDCGLGLPFNILSYSILTHLIAQVVNMDVGEVICSLGDCHIYKNQLSGLNEQISRNPHEYELPKIEINDKVENINNFTFDDIKIVGYESYPKISLPLSVG